jgi:hypothetical protein
MAQKGEYGNIGCICIARRIFFGIIRIIGKIGEYRIYINDIVQS